MEQKKKPDIIVLMAEDICRNFGCYGDENARTPRLNEFAKENVRFNYCYSAAPVCSAARSSLNLGMYGSSAGVGQHRSMNGLPDYVKNIGYYLQKAGYFTIIGKTDFNYPLADGYDVLTYYNALDTPDFAEHIIELMEEAPEEKPVFIMQTSAITHQSQYGYTNDTKEHRSTMPRLKKEEFQKREKVTIPEYHFNSDAAREIWGQYHEKMTSLDRMFGETIDKLKEKGRYENTLLFIIGDNGHGIPEGKVNLWDEGVHVPMLLHVPKEFKDQLQIEQDEHGGYCERMVSFVDFAATFLSVAGADIPPHMEGKPFLGLSRVKDPEDVFSFGERCDEIFENSRSIHEKDIMYCCDFALTLEKRLNTYQTIEAPWFISSMIEEGKRVNISKKDRRSLFQQMERVKEQMFDLKKDRYQLHNLCTEEAYKKDYLRLREKMFTCIRQYRDGALLPEPLAREIEKAHNITVYEILRNDTLYPIDELIDLWRDGLDGKDLTGYIEKKELHPAGKLMLLRFVMDGQLEGEKAFHYVMDDSETVRAYAAFVLEKYATLVKICRTSENFVLLLFIIDLIAVRKNEETVKCLHIISDRYFVKKELKADERFEAAMFSAIHMLALRYKVTLDNLGDKDQWDEKEKENSYMVMERLDFEGYNVV